MERSKLQSMASDGSTTPRVYSLFPILSTHPLQVSHCIYWDRTVDLTFQFVSAYPSDHS